MDKIKPIIVLDDDPTGTQTVHHIPVLTTWDTASIKNELDGGTALFYVLTNSRALVEKEAVDLAKDIGANIKKSTQDCYVISRSDSTLRGHFPAEVDALAKALFDVEDYLIVLAPAFFEGNRVTKDDIHFIRDKGRFIPVTDSPYAQDKTFGYKNANLRDWIIEKSKGEITANQIDSISLTDLENDKLDGILLKVEQTPRVLVLNALTVSHFESFIRVLPKSNRKIIFRTGASFVSVLGQISPQNLLEREDFEAYKEGTGGLIIVGSHVPQTTKQLRELFKTDIARMEFEVEKYLLEGQAYLIETLQKLKDIIHSGEDLVLYTSRELISKTTENESLLLSVKVSEGLIFLVKNLEKRPAFLMAKGGITSSDIATKGLGIKRAIVLGQILPGVPVWRADEQSRFPDLTFVVFPGNVGDDMGLIDAYRKMR